MSVISISERGRTEDGGFEVMVSFEGAGEYSAQLGDPLSADPTGESLLAWYFEEHLRYPFLDGDKKRAAVELLESYGSQLFQQLFGPGSEASYEFKRLQDGGFDGLRIEIVGGADFHRLHWEALRGDGAGAPLGARVPISRRVDDTKKGFDIADGGPVLNVLVVTARPHGARDVGYRTISRPLLTALRQARIPVALDLVRPGSWKAFRDHLQAATMRHGSGWYGIVHFDVHGAVANEGDPAGDTRGDYLLDGEASNGGGDGAYLFFETPKVGVAEQIPTSQVADLLVEHRVPAAVLNACQSAMQTSGSEASLAQRLVESGVPVAVGMAYSVTVSAAELMMPIVYKEIADGVEILPAVHTGRRRLFDVRRRGAYFDQEIELEDWVLPVVFSQRPVEMQPRPATPEQIEEIYARKAWQLREPEPEYGFVGRDLDVQEIERLLVGERAHNELLVSGMAGAGKSTLLEHLGWWWQATGLVERVFRFSYEERAWTVDQILQEVINTLLDGEKQALARALSSEAQLEQVATLLNADRHLLILDNAESITATPASIPHSLPEEERRRLEHFLDRLRGGKTLVLVGSRESEGWLAPSSFGSNTYELGGLDSQATSVLVERVISRHGGVLPDSSDEHKALRDLVNLLGGYPLALSVVLPVVASTPPSAVLAELERGGGAVDPAGVIQKAIELSHGKLDLTTQNSLAMLAPFTHVVPKRALGLYGELLEQHEAVTSLGALDLSGALDHAVGAGLASPDAGSSDHIRLQPLLPFFLRTRLADRSELLAAMAQAHEALYQQLGPVIHSSLRSHEPGPRAIGKRLAQAEYPNLMAALSQALDNGSPVAPLVGALEEYLDQTHQEHARQQLLERVVAAIGESSDGARQAELAGMHNLAGVAALARHDPDDARAHHEVELELMEKLDDRRGAARAYHQLGIVAHEQRRFDDAEDFYRKSLAIELEIDDKLGASRTYHQLGVVAQERRRFAEAEELYEKALEIKVEVNDRHSAASTYHQLGGIAHEDRRFDDAEEFYKKALAIYKEFNDRYESADTFHQLGRVAQDKRRFDDAEAFYKEALAIYEEFNDRYETAGTYHQLGIVALEGRRLEESEALFKKALEIKLEFNNRHSAASTYHQLGIIAQELHRLDDAEALYRKALEIELDFNDRHGSASTYHQLGRVAQEQRRFDDAEALYKKALEIKLEFNNHHGSASTYHQLGRVAQEQGRLEEAETLYRQAIEIKLESDDRHGAAVTQGQLGAVLTDLGKAKDAIPFSLASILTRYQLMSAWSEFDLRNLQRQKEMLGAEAFQAEVVNHAGEDLARHLELLFDQLGEPEE